LKVGSAGDGTEGGGADRRPVTGGRLDEVALSLGAEPALQACPRLAAAQVVADLVVSHLMTQAV